MLPPKSQGSAACVALLILCLVILKMEIRGFCQGVLVWRWSTSLLDVNILISWLSDLNVNLRRRTRHRGLAGVGAEPGKVDSISSKEAAVRSFARINHNLEATQVSDAAVMPE